MVSTSLIAVPKVPLPPHLIKRSIPYLMHFQDIFRLSGPIFPSTRQGKHLLPALRFIVRTRFPVPGFFGNPAQSSLFPFDIALRKSDLSCP